MTNPFIKSAFKLCWIGLAAAAMTLQTQVLLGEAPTLGALVGFVFCGAVFGYNFAAPTPVLRWFAWLAGIIGGLFFLRLGTNSQLVALAPTTLLALYYGLKMPGTQAGFRSIFWLKTISIGLAWSWVTVLLPALEFLPEKLGMVALLSAGRAAFICALALAYDLFDLEIDRAAGLCTLAGRLGISRTLAAMDGLLGVSSFFVATNWFLGNYENSVAVGLLVSLLISSIVLHWLVAQKRNSYWFKNIVDGLMILQFVAVLLAK